MVNTPKFRGQSSTEFILVMLLLTLIGVWIMKTMIGSDGSGGAVNGTGGMQDNGITKISSEQD